MPTDSLLTLKLPEGYSFADLKLRRCDDDAIDLDMDLVKKVCSINGLDLRDNMQAMQAMQQMAGATELTVTVERQGEQFDVYVRLSE